MNTDYSKIDKLLHKFAFDFGVSKVLKNLEDDMYKKAISETNIQSPVFVTGLPRSGTTLLLNALFASKEFATFTYRHMPFITCPLIWNKLSNKFQKKGVEKERTHGDGMTISFDSPEAFEEIIWLELLRLEIITDEGISPIHPAQMKNYLREAFIRNIKKLILLESNDQNSLRYLSKNNMNISRIPCILELFPDAQVLVPFRNPADHIASLRFQHQKFLNLHKQDKFSLDYMRWTGHRDFGQNFKPIMFDGLAKGAVDTQKLDDEFWSQYWCDCYSSILNIEDRRVKLVDYDMLLSQPKLKLEQLASTCGLESNSFFLEYSENIRPPMNSNSGLDISDVLAERVSTLHQRLISNAI